MIPNRTKDSENMCCGAMAGDARIVWNSRSNLEVHHQEFRSQGGEDLEAEPDYTLRRMSLADNIAGGNFIITLVFGYYRSFSNPYCRSLPLFTAAL